MTKPGLVSIMMPAYNAEPYIEQAIDSVLAQTYPHWDLILVDDGSTDETPGLVAGYTDPRIKVIRQPNGGESTARNTALEHTQGEFLAFLDADDLYLPQHLELAIGCLQRHPDVDGVYTDGYHCDQDGNRLPSLSSRRRGPCQGPLFERVVRASDVFGPPVCIVLRQDIIARHHLRFDPDIVIGPDWDFMTRYTEFAHFQYIDEPTCLYRLHQTNLSSRTDLQQRARYLARCREKAIGLEGFGACSLETRTAVFYDLLVNLLSGAPERQSAIVQWSQFRELPAEEQARLFRLMASRGLLHGVGQTYVRDWVRRSRQLHPGDLRGRILSALYQLEPAVCRTLLRIKARLQPYDPVPQPFADLAACRREDKPSFHTR